MCCVKMLCLDIENVLPSHARSLERRNAMLSFSERAFAKTEGDIQSFAGMPNAPTDANRESRLMLVTKTRTTLHTSYQSRFTLEEITPYSRPCHKATVYIHLSTARPKKKWASHFIICSQVGQCIGSWVVVWMD